MATYTSILPREPYEQYEKAQKYDTRRCVPGQKVSNMLMERRGRQLWIGPERIKWLAKEEMMISCGLSGGESKVRCYKEQYCLGTWNVTSMNQGKLNKIKQEMAGVNIDILGISELKWRGMGKFISYDHHIYCCGQESRRRNGVVLRVNKRVWNAVFGCSLKNNRMISVHFQSKQFNLSAIQVYNASTDGKEVGFEWFYEDLPEKAMATYSSMLAWKIPWPEEPGRLQSMGSRRVRHDWSDLAAAVAAAYTFFQDFQKENKSRFLL